MPFTIRPKTGSASGGLSMTATEPREALDVARHLIEAGHEGVEIIDTDEGTLDLMEIERMASTRRPAAAWLLRTRDRDRMQDDVVAAPVLKTS